MNILKIGALIFIAVILVFSISHCDDNPAPQASKPQQTSSVLDSTESAVAMASNSESSKSRPSVSGKNNSYGDTVVPDESSRTQIVPVQGHDQALPPIQPSPMAMPSPLSPRQLPGSVTSTEMPLPDIIVVVPQSRSTFGDSGSSSSLGVNGDASQVGGNDEIAGPKTNSGSPSDWNSGKDLDESAMASTCRMHFPSIPVDPSGVKEAKETVKEIQKKLLSRYEAIITYTEPPNVKVNKSVLLSATVILGLDEGKTISKIKQSSNPSMMGKINTLEMKVSDRVKVNLTGNSKEVEITTVPDKFDGLQFFTDAAPDAPDLIHRKQSHQLPLPFKIRQIHHSSGLSLPLYRRMIGQLRQSYSLGYAAADREVRPAQNRLANFPAKVGKIATVTHTS